VFRVFLVDMQVTYREALALVLEQDQQFTVVGQAASGETIDQPAPNIDLALVGLPYPDHPDVGLIRKLRSANPRMQVIAMTADNDRASIAMAVEAGATGVLTRSAPLREAIDTLRRSCLGEQLLTPDDTIELLRLAAERRELNFAATLTLGRLTRRELQILQVLAEGLGDREIAERLNISTETVRTHFVHILGKLDVSSRIQALIFAVRYGAVRIPTMHDSPLEVASRNGK
jgi:DNA-binding NarL/FixJ family response regulator